MGLSPPLPDANIEPVASGLSQQTGRAAKA
jgi:hypothetical protein